MQGMTKLKHLWMGLIHAMKKQKLYSNQKITISL